jgi:hypothetical protein
MTRKRCVPESSQSFPNALAALADADRLHAGQRRQPDGAPFILHPLEKPSSTANGPPLLPDALCP